LDLSNGLLEGNALLGPSFGLIILANIVEFIELFDDPFPVGQRQEHRLTMLLLINNILRMNWNHWVISIANGKTPQSRPTVFILPGETLVVNPDQRMIGKRMEKGVRNRFGSSWKVAASELLQESVVAGVRADPKPRDAVPVENADGAVADADTGGVRGRNVMHPLET
jgi:hypothetical protein